MTLGELRSQFLAIMNRTDLSADTSGLAQIFINQAILRLQRELRIPAMERVIRYTISSDYQPSLGFLIPSDLLELIDINVDSDRDGVPDYPLQRVQLRDAMVSSQVVGCPRVFARRGGYFILGPRPKEKDIIEIVYHAEFKPLVLDTDVNVISQIAWDAIVYGALAAAGDYYVDDRTAAFDARYSQITQNLQAMADGDELTADAAVRPALIFENDYSNYSGRSF